MPVAPTVLKVDIDADADLPTIWQLTRRLRFAGKTIHWVAQQRSRSGRGWHLWIAITPPTYTAFETIALQSVCGSDPSREANNVLRVRQLRRVSRYWRDKWNVFYEGRTPEIGVRLAQSHSTRSER